VTLMTLPLKGFYSSKPVIQTLIQYELGQLHIPKESISNFSNHQVRWF